MKPPIIQICPRNFGHKKRASTHPRAKGRINALCNHIKLRMHLQEMHPYFYLWNKTPCTNLLDLLTSGLRQITDDTYKVCFEKVLTFIYASELFRSESGQNQRKPGVLRLLNFCPIITQSSIRLTIPVAFITLQNLSVKGGICSGGIICTGRVVILEKEGSG